MRILDAWPFLADPFMIVLRSIHGYFLEKGGGREDIFISSLQVVSPVEKKVLLAILSEFCNHVVLFMSLWVPPHQFLLDIYDTYVCFHIGSTYPPIIYNLHIISRQIPIVQVHNTYQDVFLFRIKSKKPLENHRYHPQRVSVNCELAEPPCHNALSILNQRFCKRCLYIDKDANFLNLQLFK